MHHAAREISPLIWIVNKRMLHSIELRFIQPEPVRSRNEQAAIRSDDHPPLAHAIRDDFHVFETPFILAQASSRDLLAPDLHGPPVGKRNRPYVVIQLFQRISPRSLARRRTEIREVDHPIPRKVGIKHHFVKALCADGLHAWHTLNWRGHGPVLFNDA